jgi:hypothetical protein
MPRDSSPFPFHVRAMRRVVADAAREQGLSPSVIDGIVLSRTARTLREISEEEAARAVEDYLPDDDGGDAA